MRGPEACFNDPAPRVWATVARGRDVLCAGSRQGSLMVVNLRSVFDGERVNRTARL